MFVEENKDDEKVCQEDVKINDERDIKDKSEHLGDEKIFSIQSDEEEN